MLDEVQLKLQMAVVSAGIRIQMLTSSVQRSLQNAEGVM